MERELVVVQGLAVGVLLLQEPFLVDGIRLVPDALPDWLPEADMVEERERKETGSGNGAEWSRVWNLTRVWSRWGCLWDRVGRIRRG